MSWWSDVPFWFRFIAGLIVSIGLGAWVLSKLIGWLWKCYEVEELKKGEEERLMPDLSHTYTTVWVGSVERLLYTTAICVGAWQWIGLWVGVKVAVWWRGHQGDKGALIADNIWLIGNGLSIAFGLLGALIALGTVPYMSK